MWQLGKVFMPLSMVFENQWKEHVGHTDDGLYCTLNYYYCTSQGALMCVGCNYYPPLKGKGRRLLSLVWVFSKYLINYGTDFNEACRNNSLTCIYNKPNSRHIKPTQKWPQFSQFYKTCATFCCVTAESFIRHTLSTSHVIA